MNLERKQIFLAPAALSVLDCFPTIHITPEQIGLPEQVTFKIPLEDGSELILMLPKSYAERLIDKAAAGQMSSAELLSEVLERELQHFTGPVNTINSWHFSGPIPIQSPVRKPT